MIVLDEFGHGSAQRRFTDENHPVQTGFLDGSDEALRVRVRGTICGRSEPNVWRGSCHAAKGTSGPRCERSSITIMKNGRTKV
jgi:hypothetical protein